MAGSDGTLVTAPPLRKVVGNRKDFLSLESPEEEARRLRRQEHTGRPLRDELFIGTGER